MKRRLNKFLLVAVTVAGANAGLLRVDVLERSDVLNVFGLLAVTRAVLPHMRARRGGHVLNISSVGGYQGVHPVRLVNVVAKPGWITGPSYKTRMRAG